MKQSLKKELKGVLLAVLLLPLALLAMEAEAQTVSFIDLTEALTNAGFDPDDEPFGIDCGTVEDQFVYVTVLNQGLLARIDKNTNNTQIFNNPDDELFQALDISQEFYSIQRDPNSGHLYINERANGKLWRFDPQLVGPGPDGIQGTIDDTGWTRIPLIEQLTQDIIPSTDPFGNPLANPYFEYGIKSIISFADGYNRAPNVVRAHTNSIGESDLQINTAGDGTIEFTNGFIWVGLTYFIGDDFTIADGVPLVTFTGVARIDPNLIDVNVTQAVKRIPIPGEGVYRDIDSSGDVSAGDIRLANARHLFTDGSTVTEEDPDLGTPLVAFLSDEKHSDTAGTPNVFDVGEGVYRDIDSSGDVSAGDIRLANAPPSPLFTDGSTVTEEDPDLGTPLVAFLSDEKHSDTAGTPNVFDEGPHQVTGLIADSVEPNILWITDFDGSRVLKFDTNAEIATETINLPANSNPRGIDNDSNSVFVAFNKFLGGNSEILQINKADTSQQTIIDTTAPNTSKGTFSVFVNNDLLVWTDGSSHVGIIDLSTAPPSVLQVVDTETTRNHFGCVPFDGQFWFAGRGSVQVGILPHSKFIGGRPVRATSIGSGGGGAGLFRSRDFAFGNPDDPRYDSNAPVIAEVLVQEGSLKILAKITDTVGVEGAQAIWGKKVFLMSRHDGSQSWWYRVFTSDDLPATGDTLLLKIVAWDYSKNKVEHTETVDVPFGALSSQGASFAIRPLSVMDHQAESTYSITASGVRPNDQTINPQITIKNISTEPIQNIRLILSPELKGKFLLSDYAIKSIPPGSEYTVSLKLNGKSNVDAMNNPIPYSGHVIISVDNKTPYILEISGKVPNESASLQSLFMNMISSKAENRYKSFEKPELRISQDTDYKITLGSGESMVKGSDELIITNTGDKPLRNLRIMTSSVSEHIMPDQRNIDLLPAGSFVKVKLVSKLNDAGSARDLEGEIIVAPENGKPVSVPISIGKQLLKDKNEMYEVRTVSGSNSITHTFNSIVIRNSSEESIDNVRIILPQELARVFSLSEDSFKSIEPNGERIVHIKLRGTLDSSVRQILNEYHGDIIIVSSDGMKKIMPLNISWKGIPSEHFVINARDNAEELTKAAQVINFLERSYPEVTKIVGNTESKTVMYMTSSLDEVKMLTDVLAPSTYVYDDDVGFVWSNSEDINILALKEFTYRTIMQNYGTYWVKQKISADKGNWLVDGISTYVTASVAGERGMIKNNLDAFIAEPASFEWYGPSTPSQYGASHMLFKFLAEKYGGSIIDRTLSQLGSTMVSNSKCDTIEQCAVLMAVYDANGWSINDKRYDMNFRTIIEEWWGYE